MTYKFTLYGGEEEGFVREYVLDSEATFFDFHKLILSSVDYKDGQHTSFFICEYNWEMKQEITLEDMGGRSDEDNYIMATTKLDDFLDDEGQRLVYVFDPLTERTFFIELISIQSGSAKPECTFASGNPPAQEIDFEDFINVQSTVVAFDDDGYGDDDFDDSELDPDGYDFSDGAPYSD